MTKIKICGLKRKEDILYANECKPDYVGFVFAKSKRQVTKKQAKEMKELLDPDICAVGVFVDEEIEKVSDLVNEKVIDMVQLHGNETREYIHVLRKYTKDVKIIKAVRVSSEADLAECEESGADYLLFDTFSKDAYGGTGKVFDWELLKDVKKPFFLAGGINSSNIETAIAMENVYAIDVSSAVETDGLKDKNKMMDIVRKVRK